MQAQPGNNKTEEKMKKILIIAAAVLAFAGCAKEAAQVERVTIDGKEYMTFKVVAHDDVVSADTKATLSRGGVFGWEDGDPIYFVAAGGTMATGSYNASAGTITVESGDWFCASTAPFDSDDKIKDFGLAKGPVVWAKVNGSTLHFYHIGSVINVKFDNIPIDGYLEFWPNNASEKWAGGKFHFIGNEPELDTDETDAIYIKRPITTADAGKDISLTVPNRQYFNGFTVALSGTSARYFVKSTSTKYELGTLPTLLNMQELTVPTYTVAGDPATLFNGYSWAPDATVNDMELQESGELYVKTYINLPSYLEFKVVENHAWGGGEWGDNGSNYVMYPGKVGGGMTITFSPDRTPEIEVNEFDMYTVVGSSGLCGVNWENKIEEIAHWETTLVNDMEEASSGVWYKKFTSIPAGDYEFKIAKNHSWGEAWPTSNFSLSTTATGDVEVFFYTANNFVRVAGYSDIYVVAGSESDIFNGETWNPTADVNKMSIQNDGTYAISYSIPDDAKYEGDYKVYYKITRAGAWPDGANKEIDLSGDRGKTLTVYYNPVNDICSYLVN